MLSQKKIRTKTLKIFNNQIQLFFQKLMKYFPNEDSIKSLNKIIETFCKYNPAKLIFIWNEYIGKPYYDLIMKGDFNYFKNKNYSSDLRDLKGNVEYVLQAYDKLRVSINKLDKKLQMSAMQDVQILTNLSKKYFE